ncbi:hypothetical protein [Amycolatopsis sp. NPDC051061]|uniref:hypothetical protein n=1 Tax=Amycolatopsis sp. NPDC051061 TaxID=3155042 RepID=UPI003437E911
MNGKLSGAAALAITAAATFTSVPAEAAPHSPARIEAHFDFASGQTPENAALEPDGGLDVTFSLSRQIARIGTDGTTRILATMPQPADGGVNTPALHFPATMGIVRDTDGTLYFLYATGSADLTGVWQLRPGGTPERIAALPANGLPNGMALDQDQHVLYIADAVLGTVWTVPTAGGPATAWTSGPALRFSAIAGANGVKIHNNALWVSNSDAGTLVRIPFGPGHRAGRAEIRATGLTTIDDFAFTGSGDEILAALNHPNQIVRIRRDGTHTTVLSGSDGLQNPTAIEVRRGKVYVLDAAYVTQTDPNLLTAPLRDLC